MVWPVIGPVRTSVLDTGPAGIAMLVVPTALDQLEHLGVVRLAPVRRPAGPPRLTRPPDRHQAWVRVEGPQDEVAATERLPRLGGDSIQDLGPIAHVVPLPASCLATRPCLAR